MQQCHRRKDSTSLYGATNPDWEEHDLYPLSTQKVFGLPGTSYSITIDPGLKFADRVRQRSSTEFQIASFLILSLTNFKHEAPLHRRWITHSPLYHALSCSIMSTRSTFPMISTTEEVKCGVGSDCEITLVCNNRRFIVLLSRCPLPAFDNLNSIEGTCLKRLDGALESRDPLEVDNAIEEISGFVATLCQSTFQEFASVIENEFPVIDLDSCLNPKTFRLKVVTVDGKPKVIRCNGNDITHSTFSGLHLRTTAADLNLPKFSPKQVKVLEKYKGTSVLKVSARGQVMCCKVADDRTHIAIDREFRCLRQVSAAGFDPPLRIPRLCGVIGSGNDSVLGILITNITPNPETPRLGLIDINAVAVSRRKKWASQIEEIIEKLHDVGVVWGDAKADNILIDRNDDTWVIDFGGGWTEHWVHPDLADSVKGDLQGLKGIFHFLGVPKSAP